MLGKERNAMYKNQKIFEEQISLLNSTIKSTAITNSVGFRIKKTKEMLHISQTQLAEKIKKSRSLIEKYENYNSPKRGFSIYVLQDIATALTSFADGLFEVTVEHLAANDPIYNI